ncbi:uracil-xanthine permease family protein [Priestia flexa]|uniref:uracil-xanthine permease family protein n=1 Tax=Priestia flexa TaxID=86664 RepID=UPI00099E16F7|nr:solute carrier family 23 protein [Priestia flexa]AQX53979.1 uracil permease [Priestia flexa]
MKQQIVLDIHDRPSPVKWLALSIQHLFAMFGATILVPFLVGLSPAVALISSGVGTLAFLLITRGQVPAYLGSSFAFITPIISAKATLGPEQAMVGCFLAGLVYGIVALVIKGTGINWVMKLLPPIVVGPVIIVIGLGLANTAVSMAMNDADGNYSSQYLLVALVTLAITVICSVYFKNIISLIPIFIGIVGGYLFAYTQGLVSLKEVKEAPFIAVPDFYIPFVSYTPSISLGIILVMVPVAVVTLSEHIGHLLVLNKIVDRNYIEKPGLHRTVLGDGVATMLAGLMGGPPNTTYGENIGVLAITRVFSVFVLGGAAVIAILFGFSGKVTALISSVPSPVMGGVSILLFGIIAASGLRMMVDGQVDLGDKRNLVIASIILVLGVGGAHLELSEQVQIDGMALATIVGIILNLVLPKSKEQEAVTSEVEEVQENQKIS